MAKAKTKVINQGSRKVEQKGAGKGYWPAKRDSYYEHAGVAIAIHKR